MDRAKNAFKNVGFMGLLKGNPIKLKNLFVSGVTVGLELLSRRSIHDAVSTAGKICKTTAFLVHDG